jgi:hypothetical protein
MLLLLLLLQPSRTLQSRQRQTPTMQVHPATPKGRGTTKHDPKQTTKSSNGRASPPQSLITVAEVWAHLLCFDKNL